VDELSAARGEVGTAAAITKVGKKKFMERWKSTILASQVTTLLSPEGQASVKIREKAYQWIDPLSDEIVVDSRLLLNEVLKLMRPDVQANIYAELAKIKNIKPVDYGYAKPKYYLCSRCKGCFIFMSV